MVGSPGSASTPRGCRFAYLTATEGNSITRELSQGGADRLATAVRADIRGQQQLSIDQFWNVLQALHAADRTDLVQPAVESNIRWSEAEFSVELDPDLRTVFEYLYLKK